MCSLSLFLHVHSQYMESSWPNIISTCLPYLWKALPSRQPSPAQTGFQAWQASHPMCFLLHPLAHPDKPERSPASSAEVAVDLPRAERGKRKSPDPSQPPASLQSPGLTSLPASTVGRQSPHTFMPRSLLYGIFLCFLPTNRAEGLWVF